MVEDELFLLLLYPKTDDQIFPINSMFIGRCGAAYCGEACVVDVFDTEDFPWQKRLKSKLNLKLLNRRRWRLKRRSWKARKATKRKKMLFPNNNRQPRWRDSQKRPVLRRFELWNGLILGFGKKSFLLKIAFCCNWKQMMFHEYQLANLDMTDKSFKGKWGMMFWCSFET